MRFKHITYYRCGRCAVVVTHIDGNPSMCPCCRRSAVFIVVAKPEKKGS